MRHTIAILGGLLLATPLIAQEQNDSAAAQQNADSQIVRNEGAGAARDPALDRAPEAVKEQIMRHAASADLQELSSSRVGNLTVYDALFQGENSQTQLRLAENGAPISMIISGGQVNEAAGAERNSGQSQEQPAANNATENQTEAQAEIDQREVYGPPIHEPAGAKRDDVPGSAEQEKNIQQLQQTQDPGETQGVPSAIRQNIQQQLGDIAVEEIQPKTFYQLNIRENGQLQQVWADDKGNLLKPQQ